MSDQEKEEWNSYFEFLEQAIEDSPHCCDDKLMIWHAEMMGKMKKKILGEELPSNQG